MYLCVCVCVRWFMFWLMCISVKFCEWEFTEIGIEREMEKFWWWSLVAELWNVKLVYDCECEHSELQSERGSWNSELLAKLVVYVSNVVSIVSLMSLLLWLCCTLRCSLAYVNCQSERLCVYVRVCVYALCFCVWCLLKRRYKSKQVLTNSKHRLLVVSSANTAEKPCLKRLYLLKHLHI